MNARFSSRDKVEDRPYEHKNIRRQDDPQKGFLQVVIENDDMPHRYSCL